MNAIMENITGLKSMTDQMIATDFLVASKTGLKTYAVAIGEATHPEVRAILKKQLDEATLTHEAITAYMVKKGYYHPFDPKEQMRVDLQAAEVALKLAD
ncbi:spore coat protein [Paenibacillus sp.]|uniref:spore coat protein n=1 Tax=Paenibacillus sp. TaxID=58172 RepID=UPI002D4A0942|nr:spore coat protein [Paenibacillus sp.]HZG86551.1 spore coat protein [Paenibacillus sp.]